MGSEQRALREFRARWDEPLYLRLDLDRSRTGNRTDNTYAAHRLYRARSLISSWSSVGVAFDASRQVPRRLLRTFKTERSLKPSPPRVAPLQQMAENCSSSARVALSEARCEPVSRRCVR